MMIRNRTTPVVLVCLLIFVVSPVLVGAGTKWARTIGPGTGGWDIFSICATADGGYVCAGRTQDYQVLVMKLDPSGSSTWQRAFTGDGGARWVTCIAQTSDGGYICGGVTSATAGNEGVLLRLDASGNLLWQRTYGWSGSDSINSVFQTSDGGFLLVGGTPSRGLGGTDAWIGNLDSAGNMVWEKTIGGPGEDLAEAALQLESGEYVVAGSTSSYGAGEDDGWILKLSRGGSLLWQKAYGGTGSDSFRSVSSVSGDLIVCGRTASYGLGGDELWALRLGSTGNIVWQHAYGGMSYEEGISAGPTGDGGFGLLATTSSFGAGASDFWALKLDSSGAIAWQRTYGGLGTEILDTGLWTASGPVMAGRTASFGHPNDTLLVRASESGENDPACGALSTASAGIAIPTSTTPVTSGALTNPGFSNVSTPAFSTSIPLTINTLLCTSSDDADLTGSWSRVRVSGSRVTATFLCENAGTAPAGAFTVQFYLARTARPDSRSRLIKTRTVSSLAAGGSKVLRLRSSKSGRDKYLVAIVDTTGAVDEQDESNNSIAIALPR